LPLNGVTQGAEKASKTEALSVYVNGEADHRGGRNAF
jgi:hypothetical protein